MGVSHTRNGSQCNVDLEQMPVGACLSLLKILHDEQMISMISQKKGRVPSRVKNEMCPNLQNESVLEGISSLENVS